MVVANWSQVPDEEFWLKIKQDFLVFHPPHMTAELLGKESRVWENQDGEGRGARLQDLPMLGRNSSVEEPPAIRIPEMFKG